MKPPQAIPLLEQLIAEGEEVKSMDRGSSRVKEWEQTALTLLEAAFGIGSQNVDALRTAKKSNFIYLPGAPDSEYQKMHFQATEASIAVLRSASKQLRWKLNDPNQVFLPAGSQHDAYIELRKIVQESTHEILIVDGYVDDSLWRLLTNLQPSVKIRVLTQTMKGDFTLEGKKFVIQRGNPVEVRLTSSYHDRFIVTDGQRCWHIGASIKDAGSKAFAFSEIIQRNILNFILNDVESTWATAVPVAP